tara:strand:+ start:79 stop:1296 length:1218 start_codon:yes stop_codon:yes gene_type:complete
MKKFIASLITCLISIFSFGQNDGCDGVRYIDDSFHDVTTISNVLYGSNTTIGGKYQDLYMDVFEPSNDTEDNRPLIILAFGGAFVSGEKEKLHDLASAYARKGYVAASIDYRLYDKLALIDSALLIDVVVKGIGDMRAAIRYFKEDFSENGNTYGIDTNCIFVGGLSSGGIIACHIGLLNTTDEIPEYLQNTIEANGGWEGNSSTNTQYSSEVTGVLSFSGGIKEIEWITETDVPVFSVHETGDAVVPYQRGPVSIDLGSFSIPLIQISGGKQMYDALQSKNVKSELISIPVNQHMSYFNGSTAETYSDSIMKTSSKFMESIFCDLIVKNNEVEYDFFLFPNPVSDYLTITTKTSFESLSIYDSFGKMLLKTNERNIFLGHFSKGYYFIRIDCASGTQTKKIMIK